MDEATSSLDLESELEIIKNIRNHMSHKTIVAITHRMSSIESSDNILVIDKGQLEASGIHQDLINNSSLYKMLYLERST